MNEDSSNDFTEAGNQRRTSFIGEIIAFLRQNKQWWLLPIIFVFILFGLLVIFGSSAVPFIYTLF